MLNDAPALPASLHSRRPRTNGTPATSSACRARPRSYFSICPPGGAESRPLGLALARSALIGRFEPARRGAIGGARRAAGSNARRPRPQLARRCGRPCAAAAARAARARSGSTGEGCAVGPLVRAAA